MGPAKEMLIVPSLVELFAGAVPTTTVLKPVPLIVLKPDTALETLVAPTVLPSSASAWILESLSTNCPGDASTSQTWKDRPATGVAKLTVVRR